MSGRGGIPAELMRLRQWVVWRAEERDGKPTKVPCIAVAPDQRASSIDPRTWGTYQEARAAVDAGRADGVGFVFSEADPYCGVDLDGMRDPATAALTQAAEQTLSDLDSYSEISPSGSGVHIIVRARLEPGARRRFGSFEVYDRGRFFTMTGLALNGSVIAERQVELDAWHARVFPAPAPIAAPARPVVPVDLADHAALRPGRLERCRLRVAV